MLDLSFKSCLFNYNDNDSYGFKTYWKSIISFTFNEFVRD